MKTDNILKIINDCILNSDADIHLTINEISRENIRLDIFEANNRNLRAMRTLILKEIEGDKNINKL